MLISSFALSQAFGINTPTPAATLDVVAKNATGSVTSVDGILIPRVDRQRAQTMTGVSISTMIYINSVSTGSQAGTAINIDAVGFYYFDGSVWLKLSTTSGGSFVPSVVASGRATNSFVINDGAGYTKWAFTSTTTNPGWNATTNTYTAQATGYFQLSLQGTMKPSGNTNSFDWIVQYGGANYSYRNMANVESAFSYNSGGVIVLYLTSGQNITFGSVPCSTCTGTPNYTVSTRAFSITYLGT